VLAVLPSCSGPEGNTLADIRRRGALRWGADEEGGAPYVYRDPNNAEKLIGFEIDLMGQVAAGLGVQSTFAQGQWQDLLKTLNARGVDVVVNGYELTGERLRTCAATIPYYIYELLLFAHREDPRLTGWDGLRHPRPDGRKWRIGVLESTAADKYLTDNYPETVEVVRYNGTTDAFRDVQTRNLDGTLTDTPAAVAYAGQFSVRLVGPPVERGYYVMYVRPEDDALRDALNKQIRAILADGRLKAILSKYGLWNATQSDLTDPEVQRKSETMRPEDAAAGNWEVVRRNLPLLLRAAGMTVFLSVTSMPIAVVLGLLIALGRVYGPALLRLPLTAYVELIRGTPLLLQLLFLHFGLIPLIGLPEFLRPYAPVVTGVVGLALNYAAYEAEIYRAGLLAIPVGQMEAALALGLTRRQAIGYVIVPQAVRLVIPPVTNDFINLFKDTAVCSVIAVEELSKRYNIAVNNTPRAFLELALVTAVLYLAMSYPLALLTRRMEKKVTTARA
jgi:polar amino acid transport system substrate-binding protein